MDSSSSKRYLNNQLNKLNHYPKKMLAVVTLSSVLYGFNSSTAPFIGIPEANSSSSTPIAQEAKEELKPAKKRLVLSSAVRQISAYNVGDIYQCSGDPCIAANGENVCLALEKGYPRCAANFVPFGTVLEIEGYGECLVTDRMHSRFSQNVDIAMKYEDKKKALEFGRRRLTVNIIRYE